MLILVKSNDTLTPFIQKLITPNRPNYNSRPNNGIYN